MGCGERPACCSLAWTAGDGLLPVTLHRQRGPGCKLARRHPSTELGPPCKCAPACCRRPAADWKRNEHMPEEVFCDEFHLVDLRLFDNCRKVRGHRGGFHWPLHRLHGMAWHTRPCQLIRELMGGAAASTDGTSAIPPAPMHRWLRAASTCSTWRQTWAAWASSR